MFVLPGKGCVIREILMTEPLRGTFAVDDSEPRVARCANNPGLCVATPSESRQHQITQTWNDGKYLERAPFSLSRWQWWTSLWNNAPRSGRTTEVPHVRPLNDSSLHRRPNRQKASNLLE